MKIPQTGAKGEARQRGAALALLMLVQGFCAVFFLGDLASDIRDGGGTALADWHIWLEMLANLGLWAGIAIEAQVLLRLLRRQAHAERALSAASGALHEIMEGWFADWRLTPSEADVATFTIKGCSIAEIAALRGSAEATVKTHLNAIYRKAGVSGRA